MTAEKPTVLIVNDDRETAEAIGVLLEPDYSPQIAGDGDEALRMLRGGVRPCCILLDLMMPNMSGFEFREAQLRDSQLAQIPTIVLSAVVDLYRSREQELSAAAYVRIPEEVSRLPELIEKHRFK